MPDTIEHNSEPKALPPPERKPYVSRRAMGVGGAIALLLVGTALGATSTRIAQRWTPQNVMLLQPTSIDKMRPDNVVAIKGEVGDVFGNKFVVTDTSGRALVDTGPRGEGRPVVAKGESVTVQGRFDRGVVHAQLVAHADGRNEAFGPPSGPKDGPKDGPKGPKKGSKDGPGARAERDAPPPPPPPGGRVERDVPPPPPAAGPGADDDAPPPPPAAR